MCKLLLDEPIKRSWMTSNASTSNNVSTSTQIIRENVDKNKMDETRPKSLSNDNDSDGSSSYEEDIEEKVLSESSDSIVDSFFNFNASNGSSKLMTDQTRKTDIIKSEKKASFDVAGIDSGGRNHSQLSTSLHPIKESKMNQSKTKFHINSETAEKDSSQDTNAEKSSSDSKVTFNVLKADLPGRVSFSKNDVYEIDYSDYENDTDTSRSLEAGEVYRKKNVRFEDEYCQITRASAVEENDKITASPKSSSGSSSDDDRTTEISFGEPRMVATSTNEEYEYCCPLKCNDFECLNGSTAYAPSQPTAMIPTTTAIANPKLSIDKSEQIIEEYKREIENINRRHELELKWSGNTPKADTEYSHVDGDGAATIIANDENDIMIQSSPANETNEFIDMEKKDGECSSEATNATVANSKRSASMSNASDDSPTRDSTSTVINNYLKTKKNAINAPAKAKSMTQIKMQTTSAAKKSLPLQSNGSGRKIKSAQMGAASKPGESLKLTKARSISCLQNDVSKFNEYQIDKVESWMSTHHEDTFSDTALSTSRKSKFGGSNTNLEYKKAWRETPTSNKTDDEGNYSLDDQLDTNSVDDSSYGEIELVLKKMEGRRMKISFGN